MGDEVPVHFKHSQNLPLSCSGPHLPWAPLAVNPHCYICLLLADTYQCIHIRSLSIWPISRHFSNLSLSVRLWMWSYTETLWGKTWSPSPAPRPHSGKALPNPPCPPLAPPSPPGPPHGCPPLLYASTRMPTVSWRKVCNMALLYFFSSPATTFVNFPTSYCQMWV